jgi:hypothetical protein
MTFENSMITLANNIATFFYTEEKIKPKYIIFCNNNKKKTVYQSVPKEIKSHEEINNVEKEIIHQTYIQNAINIDDDIDGYTHAIIVDENNEEHIVKKEFMLKNMFNNIHNTIHKEYTITKILNTPFIIEDKYNKNEEKCKDIIYDKKKTLIVGGLTAVLITGIIGSIIGKIKF